MTSPVLAFSPRVTCFPVVHGSGDCAVEVRRLLLEGRYDCLAVPLPPSFQADVERAIEFLPTPTVVTQRESPRREPRWNSDWNNEPQWQPEPTWREGEDDDDAGGGSDDDAPATLSYVPIDPCQPVIAALRWALGERVPRAFIDLETCPFEAYSAPLPDAYALKQTSLERFAAAILPTLQRPTSEQAQQRIVHMAHRLHELAARHRSVLCVCSLLDWPWLREAFVERTPSLAEDAVVDETETFQVDPQTLLFMLGELPYITGQYEQARAELDDDANLSIDGVKQLLLVARDAYQAEFKGRARKISPLHLRQCLKYIRNLSLVDSRLTPDLYTLVVASQQIAGDAFALHVAETARQYAFPQISPFQSIKMSVDRARLPDGEMVEMTSRLAGPPLEWRTFELRRRPEKCELDRWAMKWNPYQQCSWPPEDELIENFRSHVFERAKQIMGADLARTEKFTTSIQDGIDIRETMRHWHDGQLWVKVLPPNRGTLDCAVMLFDSPADPRDYPWRTTWFAEHQEESTLAFFATNFGEELIGPGICRATYGGALFLFPPVGIPDVWSDPRLDFTDTLEERLVAAACLHAREPHVALLSTLPPGAGWRRLARRFRKKLVHVPLAQFSDSTIQRLRTVHVLNGRQVRSYAAHFIRKA
ncbi:MAG: hypothetical protein U0939_11045 [Pirellulales bacterium]